MKYPGGIGVSKIYQDGDIKIAWEIIGLGLYRPTLYFKCKKLFGLISYWQREWYGNSDTIVYVDTLRRMTYEEVIKRFDALFEEFNQHLRRWSLDVV